ncbi:MAG: hypothetical protein JSS12_09215 [Verrucomicrobia bacterium]|nr:hypothetical protein [Verrucomicrobiota bacterium]
MDPVNYAPLDSTQKSLKQDKNAAASQTGHDVARRLRQTKSWHELLRGSEAYTRAAVVVFKEGCFEITSLIKLSANEIKQAQRDQAIAFLRKGELGVSRDFALALELVQGQKVTLITKRGLKWQSNIHYVTDMEMRLLSEVVNNFVLQMPAKARRRIERRISVIPPFVKSKE